MVTSTIIIVKCEREPLKWEQICFKSNLENWILNEFCVYVSLEMQSKYCTYKSTFFLFLNNDVIFDELLLNSENKMQQPSRYAFFYYKLELWYNRF